MIDEEGIMMATPSIEWRDNGWSLFQLVYSFIFPTIKRPIAEIVWERPMTVPRTSLYATFAQTVIITLLSKNN